MSHHHPIIEFSKFDTPDNVQHNKITIHYDYSIAKLDNLCTDLNKTFTDGYKHFLEIPDCTKLQYC